MACKPLLRPHFTDEDHLLTAYDQASHGHMARGTQGALVGSTVALSSRSPVGLGKALL